VLLEPTRIYVKPLLALMQEMPVKGLAHITGGGLTENVPRVLPAGCDALIRKAAWPQPPLFAWLQREGGVEEAEMLRVFNCGIGMVIVVGRRRSRCGGGQACRSRGDRVPHRQRRSRPRRRAAGPLRVAQGPASRRAREANQLQRRAR